MRQRFTFVKILDEAIRIVDNTVPSLYNPTKRRIKIKVNVMRKQEFGFICGDFSIALSGNGIVMPESTNQPLKKSFLPSANMDDTAGFYTLEATVDGKVVCLMPVHVVWVGHQSQPQPFLGMKAENPEELRGALATYIGKRVELKFTPQKSKPPSNSGRP